MKKCFKPLIFMLAMFLLSVSLQAQSSGQQVSRKFTNKRSDSILLYVARDAEDGRQTIKNTVEIEGGEGAFRKISLQVGDYVWAEMKNDKAQKTDRIFINGTGSESQEIALHPQTSFLTFLGQLGNNGQSNRFLGNAYNYYGVDIVEYSPRRVIDGFQPIQIFKGLGGELTPSETRSYYLQKGTGTVMPVGFIYTGADSDQQGEMTVSEYHSMKSFKKAWNVNVGVAAKHPKGVGGSVDFSYGEDFTKTENQSNVFYIKEAYNSEYSVSVNPIKAEFDYDFIKTIAEIKTPQDADDFVNTYGTHYPASVTYGGQYSQYTSVSKNDYYEAKSKNLSIKVAVEFSKSKPDVKETNKSNLTPNKTTETSTPGDTKSGSGSIGYSQSESQELQRILSNSTSRYTAIGGSITSSGDWVKDGTSTAIAVDLALITDLIDAKVLKSRYTAQDLNGIKEMVDAAVKRKIDKLKDYAPEKPTRAYKMQVDQIRVTKHTDDAQKGSKGFIKAKVLGAEKNKPIEITLFNVPKYGYPNINSNWEIHFSDDKEENKTTRTWHYFAQEANANGSFPPLTIDFEAEIWDKDDCCGDELAAVKWGEKKTSPLVPNQVYTHVMKFKDKDILVWQDWEIEATILIVPVDPFEVSLKTAITRSLTIDPKAQNISNPAVEKKPVTPFVPPTLSEEEFIKMATAKSAPAKEVKFHGQNGVTMAQAKTIAAQNGWNIATSSEVFAAFEQKNLNVYAFGMMADGRFAVPVQSDHSNFKRGANIGATGGNQGFFYTISATPPVVTTTTTTTAPAKEVKFHGQNGVTMAQAKVIAAQNGWNIATSSDVSAAFEQKNLNVYAFGMMADGRFAVPVQSDHSNFKRGANIGATGGNQGFFYTISATPPVVTTTTTTTAPVPTTNTMTPASPGFVRIQNSWYKNNYIHNQNGKIEQGVIQPNWWSSQWKIIPVHSGWVRIQNKWKPDQYLHNQNGKLEVGPIQNNWASAMWKIVPVHSGWVRIQNSWYKDRYIHNQNGKIEVGPIQNNWASAMWKVE